MGSQEAAKVTDDIRPQWVPGLSGLIVEFTEGKKVKKAENVQRMFVIFGTDMT